MAVGHELFESDVFGTSVDEDAIYLSQLSCHECRTLSKGVLGNGNRYHIYIDPATRDLVVAQHDDTSTLVRVDKDECLYALQLGSVRSVDPTAQDPEFATHLVRIGLDASLFVPGQYEKRLHEPVVSSLKLPTS